MTSRGESEQLTPFRFGFLGYPFTVLGLVFGLGIALSWNRAFGADFGERVDLLFYELVAVVIPVILVALVVAMGQDRDRFERMRYRASKTVAPADFDDQFVALVRVRMLMRFGSALLAALIGETAALIALAAQTTTTFLFILAASCLAWQFFFLGLFELEKYLGFLQSPRRR